MPTPVFQELRAEIPFQKWHDGIDRFILVATAVSFLCHFAFLTIMDRLPAPEPPAFVATAKFVPEFTAIDDFAPPPDVAQTPQPAAPVASGPVGRPSAGDPTESSLVRVLQNNPGLIEMITRDSDAGGLAASLKKLSVVGSIPSGGVRVAMASDRLPAGSETATAVPVSLTEIGVPKPAPVAIARHERRRLEPRMSRPTSDATDAETNRLIRMALRARLGAVKYCYERSLKGERDLAGTIKLQVVFAANGAAGNVMVLADTLGDGAVGRCIAGKLGQARTTAPLGRSVTVQVPYVFAAVE